MAFIAGPRQVGKTTTCTNFTADHHYFNWDNDTEKKLCDISVLAFFCICP